jgi:hypothetical protein
MDNIGAVDARDYGAFIPSFLDDWGLDPYTFRIYCRIARRAGSGQCFESINNMADACRINRKTAMKAIKRLIECRMIRRKRSDEQKPNSVDVYVLTNHTEWIRIDKEGQGCPPEGQGCPPEGQGCPPEGQGCPPEGHKGNPYKEKHLKEIQIKGEEPPAAIEIEILAEEKTEEQPSDIMRLPIQEEVVGKTDNSLCSQITSAKFDNIEQWKFGTDISTKLNDQQICVWFLEVYQQEKPSNFTEHTKINADQLKKIKKLVKDYPLDAIEKFRNALIWVREQSDGWWRSKQFSLSNLMTNGKVAEFADKHATAMKYDSKYRSRIEGQAPSMDKERFVIDDKNENTGATAQIARLYATDPMFRMLMEAGK